MSNSSLVTYKHIVKHKTSGRGGNKIQKIFVHHMAGCLTVKQCGSVFDNRQASAHYGVNGSAIGQYVDEKDTAWHCGNFSWNQKSIGIELANDAGAKGMWHVSDATINTAIKLIADICRRNGITYLSYTGNMNGNLCMHRWVCSTSCPGPYLSNQFARIAKGVNDILGGKAAPLKLDVDGVGGPLTVSRMQEFLGTPIDGVISGQNKDMAKHYPALESVVFDDTDSTCIHALQWLVGVYEDGVLGPDTVKAWQKFLGVKIDGIFGPASMKAWQKYLNEHEKAVFPATHVTKPVVKTTTPAKTTTTAPKTTTTMTNAAKIVEKAKSYAWAAGTASSKYSYSKGSAKKTYKTALKKYMGHTSKIAQSDCGYFITTCVRASGVSSSFLALKGTKEAFPSVPSSMTIVHKGSKIPDGLLKPGDIIRYKKTNGGQHVLMCYASGKIAEAGRGHQFPAIEKDTKKYNKSNVKKSTIQVIRAK